MFNPWSLSDFRFSRKEHLSFSQKPQQKSHVSLVLNGSHVLPEPIFVFGALRLGLASRGHVTPLDYLVQPALQEPYGLRVGVR